MSLNFCCDIQMVGSEFDVKNMKAWWWWWCNAVGDIFLAHFGPLSTNWASFKHHSLPEYCCWPCPSLYDYSVPISDGYFQQDNAPCHKAQIISDWFLEHDNEFTLLKWPPQYWSATRPEPDKSWNTFGYRVGFGFGLMFNG